MWFVFKKYLHVTLFVRRSNIRTRVKLQKQKSVARSGYKAFWKYFRFRVLYKVELSNRPKTTSHFLQTVTAKPSWMAAILDGRYPGWPLSANFR